MLLSQIAQSLNLVAVSNASDAAEVSSGYASDLLSDVLARARGGTLWVTNQKHQNTIGVAVMLELAGVIIAGGIAPDDNTVEKAVEEGVALFTTDLTVYEVAGRLYQMGVESA